MSERLATYHAAIADHRIKKWDCDPTARFGDHLVNSSESRGNSESPV